METNITNKKNTKKHHCIICDYYSNKVTDYRRHLLTPKHVNKSNNTNNTNKTAEKTNDFTPNKLYKCECGKEYLHMSSLCKHKKSCDSLQTEKISNDTYETATNVQSTEFDSDMILEILKQNQEFKELIIAQNNKILELVSSHNTTNITNNNNNNNNTTNKFNLNVFLNETCKDALNMSEFLESLTLCLNDFENFGPLGYCGGITNILLKGLKTLDVNKRPIHCSDLKREVIHIKNNDVWQKDEEQMQMIKAIQAIEQKNIKQMSLWAKANPEYKDANHKKSDLYTKLIDNSLGETDEEKAQKNYHKIIRSVAKEILVEK
jgi:hypothetical protein